MANQYDINQQQLQGRRGLLNALSQQSLQNSPGGMVGNTYVAPGLLQALQGPLVALLANYGQGKVNDEQQANSTARAQALAQAIQGLNGGGQQQAPQNTDLSQGSVPMAANPGMQAASPQQPSNPNQDFAQRALSSDFPELQNVGAKALLEGLKPGTPETFALQQVRGANGELKNALVGNRGTFKDAPEGYAPYVEPKVFRGEVYDPTQVQPGQNIGAPFKDPTTNVNITQTQEGKRAQTLGEDEAKQIIAARGQVTSAQRTFNLANRLQDLDQTGVLSGPTARPAVFFGQLSQGLGIPLNPELTKKLANTENYNVAIGTELKDMILNSSAGRGFTDTDRDFVEKSFPNLMQTPEGRQQAIGFLKDASVRGVDEGRRTEDAINKGTFSQLDITGGKMQQYQQGRQAVPAASQAPAKGTVMDGYIFQGGDPSEPGNWSKQ